MATRPVPRSLTLDQPSQVYYRAGKDAEESPNVLRGSHRARVMTVFGRINRNVAGLKGGFNSSPQTPPR